MCKGKIMKKKEFDEELKALEDDFHTKKRDLYSRYAHSNTPFGIGDKVRDKKGSIKVSEMWVTTDVGRYSEMTYRGVKLKMDGDELKIKKFRNILQRDLIQKGKKRIR